MNRQVSQTRTPNQSGRFGRSGLILAAVLLLVAAIAALPAVAQAQGQAMVRVMHASPDAPAVDVYVNGNEAFSNLAFPNASDYASLDPGSYAVEVFPASADGSGDPVIDVPSLDLAAQPYTVVAVGRLAEIEPLVLQDNLAQPDAGMAHVRFVHASPDAPAVDVATAEGTTLFSNVAFKGASEWTPVQAGTYDLEVKAAGTDTVALAVDGVGLMEGGIYTIFATGLMEDDSLNATVVTYEAQSSAAANAPAQMPATGAGPAPGTPWITLLSALGLIVALGLGGAAVAMRRQGEPIA